MRNNITSLHSVNSFHYFLTYTYIHVFLKQLKKRKKREKNKKQMDELYPTFFLALYFIEIITAIIIFELIVLLLYFLKLNVCPYQTNWQ